MHFLPSRSAKHDKVLSFLFCFKSVQASIRTQISVAPCVDHSDKFRDLPEKIVSQKFPPQYQCGNFKNTNTIITTLINNHPNTFVVSLLQLNKVSDKLSILAANLRVLRPNALFTLGIRKWTT